MGNKRISICIGVNQYKHYPKADLKYAASDAEKVHEILKDPTRGAFNTCHLLLNEQATKGNILEVLKNALLDPDLGSDDVVLFYFSGHGQLDKSENLYLVPHDVSPLDINPDTVDITTSVHLTDIEILLDNTQTGTAIFILDACHSGGSGKLLGHLKYKDNSNIIFIGASRFSEQAYESAEIKQSRFTLALLESFYQPPNFEHWITLQQALAYVHRVMPGMTSKKRQQTLEITSHANNQNIKLTQNPRFSIDAVGFIDEIKELCELADTSIISDLGDIPDNIFVMKERKAFGTENATLIGCFYNSVVDISPPEIDLFNKIAATFSAERKINSALIIAKNEFPNSMIDRFNQSVDFRTLDQMIWQLVDFQKYLHALRREYKQGNEDRPLQPPLKEIYISLSGQMTSAENDEAPVSIDQVDQGIADWLNTENQPMGLLLGSYGTGKTTVSRVISYQQAELLQNPTNSDSRIPVIFPLRIFPRYNVVDIGGFIVSYLRNFPGLKNMDFGAFQRMNHSGKLLLIFDGFDEMGTRVDRNILKRNFAAICSLIETGREKIVVSSRPEVFLTAAEQKEIFSALETRYSMPTFHLHPLSDNQFKGYVEKRVQYLQKFDPTLEDWHSYYDRISSIPELKEIATRPVILEITISTLPTLIKENVSISKASLYEYYLSGEIERQIVDKKRDFLIGTDQRLTLIQFVAMYLLAKDQIELSTEEILNVINANLLSDQKVDAESFTRDFLACSFMLREAQSYRFSHLSFWEYLVARTLLAEIQNNQVYVLDNIVIKSEIAHFLVELVINSSKSEFYERVLWNWMESSAQEIEFIQERFSIRLKTQSLFHLVKISGKDDTLEYAKERTIRSRVKKTVIRVLSRPGSSKKKSGRKKSEFWNKQIEKLSRNILQIDQIEQSKEMYIFENLFKKSSSTSFAGGNALTILSLLDRLPKEQKYDAFNLSGANLIGFDFVDSSFQKTLFRESVFTKINFVNTQWYKTDFSSCAFNEVDIDIRSIPGCEFSGSTFNLTNVKARSIEMSGFGGCTFHQCNFTLESLSECHFPGCTFNQCEFAIETLSKCDFSGCTFNESRFHQSKIAQAIFEKAEFHQVDWIASVIEECDFNHAEFNEVLFERSTLERSNFSTVFSERVFYEECSLTDCFFPEKYTILSERGVTVKNLIPVLEDEKVIRQPLTESTSE